MQMFAVEMIWCHTIELDATMASPVVAYPLASPIASVQPSPLCHRCLSINRTSSATPPPLVHRCPTRAEALNDAYAWLAAIMMLRLQASHAVPSLNNKRR